MRGKQVRAGDAVAKTLGRLDKSGAMGRAQAVVAFKDAAGAAVSAHAMGFAMREGELVVFVDSSIWANELQALSEHYRTAVNERLGRDLVRAVRFSVSKEVERSREFSENEERVRSSYLKDRVEPVPLSEVERMQLQQMAAIISDEKMREAVVKAATADLEWRKGLKRRNGAQAPRGGSTGPETAAAH